LTVALDLLLSYHFQTMLDAIYPCNHIEIDIQVSESVFHIIHRAVARPSQYMVASGYTLSVLLYHGKPDVSIPAMIQMGVTSGRLCYSPAPAYSDIIVRL
jgi:hypothetical protein